MNIAIIVRETCNFIAEIVFFWTHVFSHVEHMLEYCL
jgi:hypothetical protein